MKKRFLFMLLFACILFPAMTILTACGSGNPGEPSDNGDSGYEQEYVNLNVVVEGLPANLETSFRNYYNLNQTQQVESGQTFGYYIQNAEYFDASPYSLIGVYLDANHTLEVDTDKTLSEDTTLYFVFADNKVSLTLVYNNDDNETQIVYGNAGDTHQFSHISGKNHYTHVGWSLDPNATYEDTDKLIDACGTTTFTTNTTWYAVWKGEIVYAYYNIDACIVDGEFKDSFDLDDTYYYGTEYNLPKLGDVVLNHQNNMLKFGGWKINDVPYTKDKLIFDGDVTSVTFSVDWKPVDSVLHFDVNKVGEEYLGSTLETQICIIEGESYSFTLPTINSDYIINKNYSLIGWSTTPNGELEVVDGGTFVTSQKEITLYGVWQGREVELVLMKGSEVYSRSNHHYGDIVNLENGELEDHDFLGWFDNKNFLNSKVESVDLLTTSNIVTLYGKFEYNKVLVTLDANGGETTLNSIGVDKNSEYTLSAEDCAKFTSDYGTLVGFSTNPQETDSENITKTLKIEETNLVYYAIWELHSVSVNYSGVSGEGIIYPNDVIVKMSETYKLTNNNLKNPGYHIDYFMVNGDRKNIGDIIEVGTQNIEIEVIWAENVGSVAFCVEGELATVYDSNGLVLNTNFVENTNTTTIMGISENDKFFAPRVSANVDKIVVQEVKEEGQDPVEVTKYFAGWSTSENATRPTLFPYASIVTITEENIIYYPVYLEAYKYVEYQLMSNQDDFYYVAYLRNPNHAVGNEYEQPVEVGTEDIVVFPSSYNGLPVKCISAWSSAQKVNNTNGAIILAEGIEYVQGSAFINCKAPYISLPNSLITMETEQNESEFGTFKNCDNLSSLFLPKNVNKISGALFNGTYAPVMTVAEDNLTFSTIEEGLGLVETKTMTLLALNEDLTVIPKEVEILGENLFALSSVESLTFEAESRLHTIDSYAFYRSKISEFNFPSSLKTINSYAFAQVETLTSVIIPNNITSLSHSVFEGCRNLTEIEFNDVITYIPRYFIKDTGVTKLYIPNNVTEIGNEAFAHCTSLTDIYLSRNLTTIGSRAFGNCTKLTNIDIPSKVSSIGSYCFAECENLKEISLYTTKITQISEYTFYKATSLLEIILPETVNKISVGAFDRCSSLRALTIHSSQLTEEGKFVVEYNAFYNINDYFTICFNGTETEWNTFGRANLMAGVQELNNEKFISSYIQYLVDGIFRFNYEKGGIELLIGEIFDGYTDLDLTSYDNKEIVGIGEDAFRDNTTIQRIVFGQNLKFIEDNAFSGCTNISEIVFAGSIEDWQKISIGSGNEALTNAEIIYETIEHSNFQYKLSNFYYSNDSTILKLVKYIGTSNIVELEASFVKGGVLYEVLEIGDGYISPFYDLRKSIKQIIVPEGIEDLRSNALAELERLESFHIPKTLRYIDTSAFGGAYSKTTNNYRYIKHFSVDPENDRYETYKNGTILYDKWYDVLAQASVLCNEIPSNITKIGEYAFSGSLFYNFIVPDHITEIGNGAFENCPNLVRVELSKNIETLYTSFSYCENLKDVIIPEGIKNMQEYFVGCHSLTYLYLPSTITIWTYPNYSLYQNEGVPALEDLYYAGTYTSWQKDGFNRYTNLYTEITREDKLVKIDHYTLVLYSNHTCALLDYSDNTATGSLVIPQTFTHSQITYTLTKILAHSLYDLDFESITLPNTIVKIDDNALSFCEYLTSFVIGSNVEYLGESAFSECKKLEIVTFETPCKITTISKYCFQGCIALRNLVLPNTITKIENFAFYYAGLIEIVIPENVTEIGDFAFSDMSNLTTITFAGNKIETISQNCFAYSDKLQTIVLPSSVTAILEYAFSNCTGLVSVVIPKSVTSLCYESFYECTNLTDIYFTGTEEEWNAIEIEYLQYYENTPSFSFTVHFNYGV